MKALRLYALCTLLGLLLPLGVSAQTLVKGTVRDADGAPVPGAAVIISGTSTGVSADAEGCFEIKASEGQTIEVSCIGFRTETLKIGRGTVYDIVLTEDSNYLDDVVVVGYDVQKKVNLTGAVSSMSMDNMTHRPITQTSTALQGMMPGVTVTTRSGNPGDSGGSIRIRGIGTFGGSSASPLILIDGVQGSLDDVDPTTIDQISVLKDAASAAIYGSRAANGVILVTTSRAKKDVFSVTYRGYAGIARPTDLPDLVNAEEYMTLSREGYINDGRVPVYTEEYIARYMENHRLDPDNYPITDWQKEILNGSAFLHNHTVTMTAGSGRITNLTSLGYLEQNGIIKRQNYHRYNVRNNMNVNLGSKADFKFDTALSYGHRDAVPLAASLFDMMNTRDPLILTRYSTGYYAPMTGGSTNVLPVTEGAGGNKKVDVLNLNASATLDFKPVSWLTIEGKFAPRLAVTHTHQFDDQIHYYADAYGTLSPVVSRLYNQLSETQTQNFYTTSLATATAHKKFADAHELKLLVGTSYETMSQHAYGASRQSLAYPQYDVLNVGLDDETKDNSGSRSQWALLSYFGRLNYNFKERYLFEANIRFDGSSRFAEGHRWGIFPSFSGAWRVSEEPFMQVTKNVLSELKLRASWGELGNQNIGSSNYPFAELLSLGSYSVADTLVPIVTSSTLANPGITWETSEMFDAGVDFTLWDKLSVTFDWYHKMTHGILMQVNIPLSTGLSEPYQNAGEVRNIGWELGIGYHDNFGEFRFGVDANLSDVRNCVMDMDGQIDSQSDGIIRNQEKWPINSIYGLKCLGIARTQDEADWINDNLPQYGTAIQAGDLYYADTNGDGYVNDNDKTRIGCAIPRYTYGLNFNFGWRGWDLTAFFQGVGKAEAYLNSFYIYPCVNGGTFRKEHLDRWTPETPDGHFPRMSYTSEHNRRVSDFWLGDASYMRLKNIQLSYTLPDSWSRKMGLKRLTLFANADNLFTFTNFYQGYDPEVAYNSSATNGVAMGAVANNYPQVKTVTAGIEIKF